MRAAPQPQTIDLPPLSIRADVASVDQQARTVDLIFSTGAAVERYDWLRDTRYLEKLSLDPKAVRLDRLNTAGPLLDAHSAWSITDQIGAVEPGTARIENGQARATVRFSKRDAVTPIWNDVVDGILRSVSVGYRVYAFEETTANGKIPTRTAIDWEPYEVSLVPMPADTGAKVRDGDKSNTNPCIVTRSQESMMNEETRNESSETIAERNPLDPGAPTGGDRLQLEREQPKEKTDADLGAAAEQDRIRGIMNACRAARIPSDIQDRLISENVPLVKAQAQIFEEMRKRGREDEGPRGGGSTLVVGNDPLVHTRAGITNALLHRFAPTHFKLDEPGKLYRGMTLMDVARAYLQARGVRVTNMSKNELAAEALGLTNRSGMHTTSDFSNLLADVANKTLRRAYEEQPQTFAPLVTRASLPDYKLVKRLQLGDAPALVQILEHGEYTSGTIGEGKEQYRLVKYGRKFAITREALINDDTDAFARLPMMFGRRARMLESDLVWEQITTNPTMGDGTALFAAGHSNLDNSGDEISVASLGVARAALRKQTSLDGALMNLSARYLVVPSSLETMADQYVTVITPQAAGSVNPFQGRLTVIAEPRLDADSTVAWYVTADPAQIDMLEVGYLEGEEGPQVESRIGFDVDGVEIKCRLDFGAKVLDWRGFFKNVGSTIT